VTEPEIIRGRFAPSPTGPLHPGSLVAALASYLMAKSRQGQWFIRIEDLDPPREIPGMAQRHLDDLAGFALRSDVPVLWQSRRSDVYETALQQLLEQDKAFYCGCSRTQLQDQQGIHRHCVSPRRVRQSAIRLRVPEQTIEFTDGLYGLQRQNLAIETGDVVLKRADGLYAYQLAVVVDDAAQGINQIVRGADLLDSTPRQIFLQRQLGLPTPEYTHIPLVLDEQGHKLSKSQWAAGLDPDDRFEALCAAYRHLGQDVDVLKPQFDIADNLSSALQHFDIERLKRTKVRG
jgi:glutamyl-Q tRNA(Asp) synthetase